MESAAVPQAPRPRLDRRSFSLGAFTGFLATAALAGIVAAILSQPAGQQPADLKLPPISMVAERIEAIRGLEFESVPKVNVVNSEEELRAKVAALAQSELTRTQPEPGLIKEMQTRALAGRQGPLLAGLFDLKDLNLPELQKGMEERMGGFYDYESGEIFILATTAKDPVKAETVLAHELTHALEEQNFHRFERRFTLPTDADAAEAALIEGSAQYAMARYAIEHQGAKGPVSAYLAERAEADIPDGVPPAMASSLRFPYFSGAEFVGALYERGGWDLVDKASKNPPASTAEILHPDLYPGGPKVKEPQTQVASAIGKDWQYVGALPGGELDAMQLIQPGPSVTEASAAAEGNTGATLEVWHTKDEQSMGCPPPCRANSAAIAVTTFDSAAAAEAYADAARVHLAEVSGEPEQAGAYGIDDGAGAVAQQGARVVMAFAPTPELAKRLAERG
jgi:hypothetical protein